MRKIMTVKEFEGSTVLDDLDRVQQQLKDLDEEQKALQEKVEEMTRERRDLVDSVEDHKEVKRRTQVLSYQPNFS